SLIIWPLTSTMPVPPLILTPSCPDSSSCPPLSILMLPPVPALIVIEPASLTSTVTVPVGVLLAGGFGLQVSAIVPPAWSRDSESASSLVPSTICEVFGGATPGGPGGRSSLNTSRLPAGETMPRLVTLPPLTVVPPRSKLVLSFSSPPSTYGRRGSPNSKPI